MATKKKTDDRDLSYRRIFKGDGKIYHDLYKLEQEDMLKNMSFSNNDPIWEKIPHVHYFHTVDSSGKIQTRTTNIGGHFHKIKVEYVNENEAPKVTCISGPLIYITKRIKGRMQKVEAPYMVDYDGSSLDDHVHEVTYRGSEIITLRKTNEMAVRMQAIEAQKTAPLPGVIG